MIEPPKPRVLILGAGGNLGAALQDGLRSSRRWSTLPVFSPRGPARRVRIDITDEHEVDDLLRRTRPDAIVHLAGLTGIECAQDPKRAADVNVRAVEHVARASLKYGVKTLLFPSTSAVYGDQYDRPATEGSKLDIRSSYAETKARAEDVLKDLQREGAGPHAVILRIFNVYGTGLTESLVERLRSSDPANPVPLRGLETFTRDYSEVSEIAKVMEIALELSGSGLQHSLTLNIGSGVPTTNSRLVEILQHENPVHTSVLAGPWSYSCADVTAARRLAVPIPRAIG